MTEETQNPTTEEVESDFNIDAMIAEVTANEEEELVIGTVEGEASQAKSKSGR